MKKIIGLVCWGVFTGLSIFSAYRIYTTASGQDLGLITTTLNTWIPIPVLGMPLYYFPIWISIGMLVGYYIRK
ncbi:MAG: hypothetical protein M0R17_07105 [Candidatus Omnitrophica bacterium]|jgi:hypothetical protein|nr:hypothetical protein [Candidatus Omnitrophota bacterium]